MSHVRPIDCQTEYRLPPAVQDWLEESHLARFEVNLVEGLDLAELDLAYAGRALTAIQRWWSVAADPRQRLPAQLVFLGYARKVEAQLRADVHEMLKLAELVDHFNVSDSLNLPVEIARSEWTAVCLERNFKHMAALRPQ